MFKETWQLWCHCLDSLRGIMKVSLAHLQRRSEAVETEKVKKKLPKRRFGDLRFDFLKACKHELGRDASLCIFCKLVTKELGLLFDKEREEKAKAREESAIRRTATRYELLQNWSKNQGLYYQDLIPAQMKSTSLVEMSFSSTLAQALFEEADLIEEQQLKGVSRGADVVDFGLLRKLLARRRCILEVGFYAVVFLQARIRKWCARRRVRHMLMLRFEYVPPPEVQDPNRKPKRAFFVDTKNTGQIRNVLPSLISDIRPNTPRTIARRVAGAERRMETRLARFRSLIKAYIVDGAYRDLWAEEEKLVSRTRSFAVLLDVAQGALRAARRLALAEATRTGQPPPASDAPLWLSLTAPGPTARQLGLSFAVDTPDYRSTHPPAQRPRDAKTERQIEQLPAPDPKVKKGGNGGEKKGKGDPKAKAAAPSAPTPKTAEEDRGVAYFEMNASLQALERRAWECLHCSNAQDILRKLLSPDMHPPMQSCISIALDDQKMWHGELLTTQQQEQFQFERDKEHGAASSKAKTHTQKPRELTDQERAAVLPINLQLRLVNANHRGPSTIFRLFFHEAELVGVTQLSEWAMYPDILRDKDGLMKAIQGFTEAPEMRTFVCAYFERANATYVAERKQAIAAAAAGTRAHPTRGPDRSLPPPQYTDGRYSARPNNPCVPLYVPCDSSLFDIDAYFGDCKSPLTPEETVAVSKANKFLSKVPAFKALLVKAQNALMRSKRKVEPLAKPQGPHPTDARLMDLPSDNSSDGDAGGGGSEDAELRGADIYRDLCVNAPGGQGRNVDMYGERLRSESLLTDPTMQGRVHKPDLITHSHAGLIDPTATRFDLLVIEVTVSPPTKQEESSAAAAVAAAAVTGGATPAPGKDLGFKKRSVELHAVIGMASCASVRPPPHVDCGLLSWSTFQRLRTEQLDAEAKWGKEPVWMKPQFNWTQQAQVGLSLAFAAPDPATGCMISNNLRTATARPITVALVGGLPSHEHLVSAVPKKQQRWMNWI